MKILYFEARSGVREELLLQSLLDLGVDESYVNSEIEKFNLESNKLNIKYDSLEKHLNAIEKSHFENLIKEIASMALTKNYEVERKIEDKFFSLTRADIKELWNSLEYILKIAISINSLKPEKILCSKVGIGAENSFNTLEKSEKIYKDIAALEVLKGFPIIYNNSCNKTTPLAAAMLISMVDEFCENKELIIEKIGYGISGDLILRSSIGNSVIEGVNSNKLQRDICTIKASENASKFILDQQYIIECNIDDMNNELYDYLITKLLLQGAADAFLTPIIMKKGRPATKISVLCSKENIEKLEEVLLRETTTFGIRRYEVQKTMLHRSFSKVNTRYGEVAVKYGLIDGSIVKAKPEYEDCKKLAVEAEVPVIEVYMEALKHINI